MNTATRHCRTCGWTGTYDSAKRADYAKRQHSCEKQIAKAAARENGARLRAAVDRAPQPCLHKVAQHQHGTYACYKLDRCRCAPCAAACSEYNRRATRDKAYGRWNGLVPADEARAHVRALQDAGMGWKRVALAANLDTSVVWKLLYGDRTRGLAPSKRIRPATAQALLAVELDLADKAVIDSVGTARRIQALCALGYSLSYTARRANILRGNFTDIAHGRTAVTAATARKIADLYDELAMVVPTATTRDEKYALTRARNLAKNNGWAPPLAWDDIDDPNETPNLGEDTKRDTLAEYEWLLDQGESEHAALQILGVSRGAIQRARGRAQEVA